MPTLSDAEQLNAAVTLFERYVQMTVPPVLDEAATDFLKSHQIASTWVENTAYVVGDMILPTVRNGHCYRCTQAGTSETLAADEPDWPTSAAAIVTEGDSDPILTWQEAGPEPANLYNVRAAAHAAWLSKAAKASLSVDIDQQVGGIKASQVYNHCIAMADKFSLLGIG